MVRAQKRLTIWDQTLHLVGNKVIIKYPTNTAHSMKPTSSSVQSLSRVLLFATPWTVARQASLSITNSWSFAQIHVHWVGVAIQPSHPLSSPSPPAFTLSQHQGLFQGVTSSHQVAKVLVSASTSVLPMNTQDWSPLRWTGWISLKSKGL